MKSLRSAVSFLMVVMLAGCAGFSRSCSSSVAENFGADWVVVQMDVNGKPYRCWELRNTSITNESQSDGIYWKETQTGNLVHISGNYNRVQVVGDHWEHAFGELGLTSASCAMIRNATYDFLERSYK